MDKRQKERTILRAVYDETKFLFIHKGERPDFVLTHTSSLPPFGVETTELYYSDGSARLRNSPGYINHLLSGGDPRHKDDKGIVRRFKLLAPDGTVKMDGVSGILRELPPIEEHSRKIAAIVQEKGNRYGDYRADLTHVNLIVMDRENRLATVDRDRLFEFVFLPELKETVMNTPFREVFFVTLARGNSYVFLPLRLTLLLSELYLFGNAFNQHHANVDVKSPSEALELFAVFTRKRGARVVVAVYPDGTAEVLLGNGGILLGRLQTTIHDYADFPLPKNARIPEQVRYEELLDEDFMNFYSEFSRQHTFTSAIVYDALKHPALLD